MKRTSHLLKILFVLGLAAPCAADWDTPTEDSMVMTATTVDGGKGPELIGDEPGFASCGDVCETCGQCDSCCPCCKCGPPGRFWIRDEYVGWFARGGRVPTLVGTNPSGGVPTTTPLYGNATYNGGFRSGNWVQSGMWFDDCKNWGLQGDFFFVGALSSPFFAQSNGDPVIGRPFVDATNGAITQQLIAFPGSSVGSIGVDNHNSLNGGGISLRQNVCCWSGCCDGQSDPCDCNYFCNVDCCRVDLLYGYRGYRFNDSVGIREHVTSIDQTTGTAVGTTFDVNDNFHTQNNFNGGELGIILDRYKGRWIYEGAARFAVGNMQQVVTINGSTAVSFPGQPTVVNQGGILALSSNIGNYTQNSLRVIPMLSGRLGYRVTPRLSFLVGYTVIFFGQVARAGDQIDTTVNPNLIPPVTGGGPNRPSFAFHTSDLWLQGITIGGEYSF